MNAFGDATFALALFLLIQQTGTLEYEAVFAEVDGLSSTVATLVALGLLGGAVAKSAQLPLQTWLPGRDGGPDAGVRPHPRGDDGRRRRLPHLPHGADLRGGAGGAGHRGHPRRADARRRRADRARADGHQARDRVLDDVADRLHVPRRRHRRVRDGDVPPAHARVLQGAALPRRGHPHPRARGRAGPAADGRPAGG